MKKLLALSLSLSLVSSTATLVVSCGSGVPKEVQFWLLQESASASGKINQAYQNLVADYNEKAKEKGGLQVKFSWKASGAIKKTMMSNKKKLPDLYVSYPDAVSYYKVASTTKDLVRDMETSYGEKFNEDIKDGVIDSVYLQEGTINNQLNILPYFKSLDFATINLNLFREVCAILIDGKVDYQDQSTFGNKLTNQINEYNKNVRAMRTSNPLEQVNSDLSDIRIFGSLTNDGKIVLSQEQIKVMQDNFGGEEKISELKTILETSSTPEETVEQIQKIMNTHSWVLKFASAINSGLVYFNKTGANKNALAKYSQGKYQKMSVKNNQNYALGIDSITNKYFTDYASASGNNKVETGPNGDFAYNVTADVNAKKADVTLNSKALGVANTNNFLDELKEISISNKNSDKSDILEQWNGTFISGKMDSAGKTYVSSYFNTGSMLYSSGSTAGMWAYQSKTNLSRYDMLISSSLNEEGNRGLFLSQGPGIAGFKSQGSNATEKEKTVTDFLNYIYKANVQAENSIQSGYLPSTKDSLSVFEKYHTEKFNNATGEWTEETKNNDKTMNEIKRLEQKYDFKFSSIKALDSNDVLVGKWLTTDLLNDFFGMEDGVFNQEQKNENLNLVVGTPNILGDGIRKAFDSAIKSGSNTMMNLKDTQNAKFAEIFASGKENYRLGKWILEARNDVISDINIEYK